MKEVRFDQYFHGKEFVDNDLLESLLLNLFKNEKKQELHLVLDVRRTPDFYAYLQTDIINKDKNRLFYHFVFTDISNFSVKGRSFSSNSMFVCCEGDKSGGELQDYNVKEQPHLSISLKFDADNECSFSFEKILFEQKRGWAVKRKNEEVWDYIDVITKAKFNFYDPFDLNIYARSV